MAKNPLQVELVQDITAKKEWRWRMWRSGRIVAMSPPQDGFVKKAQCKRTLMRLIATLGQESYVWKNGD